MDLSESLVFGVAVGWASAFAGYKVMRWVQQTDFIWRRLPWYYTATRYAAPVGYDAEFLVKALKVSESCLVTHTTWGAASVSEVYANTHIRVLPHEDCNETRASKLEGLKQGKVTVGSTLWGLCHEMAHLCETQIDRETDVGHVTWSRSGLWAAMAEYEAWLAKEMGTWKK